MKRLSRKVKVEVQSKSNKSLKMLKSEAAAKPNPVTKLTENNIKEVIGTKRHIRNLDCLRSCLQTRQLKMLSDFKVTSSISTGLITDQQATYLSLMPRYMRSLQALDMAFFDCRDVSIWRLQHIVSNLQYMTTLSSLRIVIPGPMVFKANIIKHLSHSLKSMKALTTLSLTLSDFATSEMERSSHLFRAIGSLSSLSSLAITASFNMIDDQLLESFSKAIKSLTGLSTLKLYLPCCTDITSVGIRHLATALKRLVKITELSIVVFGCREIKDQGVRYLSDALASLKNLTVLNLHMDFETLSDATLMHLSTSLSTLPALSSLTIEPFSYNKYSKGSFSWNFFFGEDEEEENDPTDIKQLLAFPKSKKDIIDVELSTCFKIEDLISLSRLRLNFSDGEDTKEFKNLPLTLRKLSQLTDLSIECRSYKNIEDERPQDLFVEMGSLKCLTKLSLEFGDQIMINYKAFQGLCASLRSLTKITHLTLNVQIPEGNDGWLESLSTSLKYLGSLVCLDLSLTGCKAVTDKGAQHLNLFLQDHKSLQTIQLSLSSCEKIGDLSLQSLGQALSSIGSLRDLTLIFEDCQKISDDGMKHLSTSLKEMKHLRRLTLNFSGCVALSGKGVGSLCSSFQGLEKLSELSLEFHRCSRVGDRGIKILGKELRGLKNLENLHLHFLDCEKITGSAINTVMETCRGLLILKDLQIHFDAVDRIEGGFRGARILKDKNTTLFASSFF